MSGLERPGIAGAEDFFESLAKGEFPYCVFRRPEKIGAAARGKADIDLLISRERHSEFVELARMNGGIRAILHPRHDNVCDGREEWLFLSGARRAIVRLDVHTVVMVGPRYAKRIPALAFADISERYDQITPLGELAVAPVEYELALEIARAALGAGTPVASRIRVRLPQRLRGPVPVPLSLDMAARLGLPGPLDVVVAMGHGGSTVSAAELGRVRRALVERSGYGARDVMAQRLRSLHHGTAYRTSRALRRIGFHVQPKRQPASGGHILVLTGAPADVRRVAAMASATIGASFDVADLLNAGPLRIPAPRFVPSSTVDSSATARPGAPSAAASAALRHARRLASRGYVVIGDHRLLARDLLAADHVVTSSGGEPSDSVPLREHPGPDAPDPQELTGGDMSIFHCAGLPGDACGRLLESIWPRFH